MFYLLLQPQIFSIEKWLDNYWLDTRICLQSGQKYANALFLFFSLQTEPDQALTDLQPHAGWNQSHLPWGTLPRGQLQDHQSWCCWLLEEIFWRKVRFSSYELLPPSRGDRHLSATPECTPARGRFAITICDVTRCRCFLFFILSGTLTFVVVWTCTGFFFFFFLSFWAHERREADVRLSLVTWSAPVWLNYVNGWNQKGDIISLTSWNVEVHI